MIDSVDKLGRLIAGFPGEPSMACSVWRPLEGVIVNPRADLDELRRTCQRDTAKEAVLLDATRAQTIAANTAARKALGRLTILLRENTAVRACSRCGATFEAWRNSGGWAKQCRKCAGRRLKGWRG